MEFNKKGWIEEEKKKRKKKKQKRGGRKGLRLKKLFGYELPASVLTLKTLSPQPFCCRFGWELESMCVCFFLRTRGTPLSSWPKD